MLFYHMILSSLIAAFLLPSYISKWRDIPKIECLVDNYIYSENIMTFILYGRLCGTLPL